MKWLIFVLFASSLNAAEPNGIQVQGKCDVKVVPDRGSVSFMAEHQAKDQKHAVKKINDQINALREKLKSLEFKDFELKTTNYNVYPVRNWEKDRYVDRGFKASMTLEVTSSEVSRLGEAMVEASKLGFTNAGALTTFLSIEKTQSEYLKCLDIASSDARKKAERLASKLGFKVGDVINLIETPAQQTPPPYPGPQFMAKSVDAAPASVESGTQQFSTTLQVTFAIK